MRNTRDPSAWRQSPQVAPYKPKAKGADAQRKSEGSTVPSKVAKKNAASGRGPWGGSVDEAGKCEGLAKAPKHPQKRELTEEVRKLQRRLWVADKRAHQHHYETCQKVCETTDGDESCMVYVPFKHRYRNQPDCLRE